MIDYKVQFKVGDLAAVSIDPARRKSGFAPVDDDTMVQVTGWGEYIRARIWNYGYEPGIYHDPSTLMVQTISGSKKFSISLDDLRDPTGEIPVLKISGKDLRKGDLPHSDFWEGDKVTFQGETEVKLIQGINWEWRDLKRNDGSPMSLYRVGKENYGYSHLDGDKLHLVERGNLWRLGHGVLPIYRDLSEEATLIYQMGQVEEIRNPASGRYHSWTQSEMLDAIEAGLAHGIAGSDTILPWGTSVYPVLFKDTELGSRVAQATLKAFGRIPDDSLKP